MTGGGNVHRVRRRLAVEVQRRADRLLERRYGVRTAAHIPLEDLGVAAEGRIWHHPSDWIAVRRAFARLEPTPSDVLVDMGSGLGRGVLIGAGFPFGRVVGVEVSPDMAGQARKNLESFRGPVRAREVAIEVGDAATWEVPGDLTVAYLYSPVVGEPFVALWERLMASVDRHPRVLRVVYNYPVEHNRLVASGRVEPLSVSSRSWPKRPDADDVIVTYLVLPEGGRAAIPGAVPDPDASVDRHPQWRVPFDPGFRLERPASRAGGAPNSGQLA